MIRYDWALILTASCITLTACSAAPLAPDDPEPPAPFEDQTACLTSGAPWTLDLSRYAEDVATTEALSAAPLTDVSATGSLTIQFTDDFLFAATTSGLTTVRNYNADGETVVATFIRNDEVSGEWDWFDGQTLVTSRVGYLAESTSNDAVIDGETTVSFFPEPPRLFFSDGAVFTVNCSSGLLVLDSDGLVPWHFLPG